MSHPDFLLDKRVVNRNLKKGIVSPDDVKQHLANLPDVEHNAEPCTPDAPDVSQGEVAQGEVAEAAAEGAAPVEAPAAEAPAQAPAAEAPPADVAPE